MMTLSNKVFQNRFGQMQPFTLWIKDFGKIKNKTIKLKMNENMYYETEFYCLG